MRLRTTGFGSSVLFAAFAAGAWPAVAAVFGPALGLRSALILHGLVFAGLYLLRFGHERLRALERRPLRALAIEVALAAVAVTLARTAWSPTLAGTALAIWAFGLVESAWFLFTAAGAPEDPSAPDPFEEALRRARATLDDL